MKFLRHKHLDHNPPHWIAPEAVYFITICTKRRNINQFCHPVIGRHILDSIRLYNERNLWFCDLAVLMPDHIHLLLGFPPDRTLTKVIGLWKRWLAREHTIVWQTNFFDHRLRNDENIDQKGEYILQNPVRAGLVERPEDWPYVWMSKE
jgi:REP element-mobilizing transposase RayT